MLAALLVIKIKIQLILYFNVLFTLDTLIAVFFPQLRRRRSGPFIQNVMLTQNVGVKWAPGHMGIIGNEAADKLATVESSQPWDLDMPFEPTINKMDRISERCETALERNNSRETTAFFLRECAS